MRYHGAMSLGSSLLHLAGAAGQPTGPDGLHALAAAALIQAGDAMARGAVAEALNGYRQALMYCPDDPAALRGLAQALLATGKIGEAAAAALAALDLAPRDEAGLRLLATIAQRVKGQTGGVTIPATPSPRALLAVLAADRIDHQDFVMLCLSYLKAAAPLAAVFPRLRSQGAAAAAAWLLDKSGRAAREDPVLLAYLARTVNLDPELEMLLTALRRLVLLERRWRAGGVAPAMLAALARQCLNNEHVFHSEDDEDAQAEALAGEIAERIRTRRRLGAELLVLSSYCSPDTLAGFADLAKAGTVAEPHTRKLMAELAAAAAEEARLRPTIPVLTAIDDGVSAAVAQQYEENPYPRWLSLTPLAPGALMPPALAGRDVSVLIAGCGTGQHAVAASLGYGPRAQVLAVDLSLASLAYAQRMSLRLGVDNLRYAQADILRLGALEQRFDIIECCGVLHHMADPLAGWRVLTGLLAPGGVLKIALYSRRARRLVIAAREAIARQGLGTSNAAIRRFRWELLAGRSESAGLAAIASDLYSLSNTRDLLFHVQEHQFTPRQIQECLAALDLEFLGFAPMPAGMVAAGSDRDLAAWDAAEERHPDLFRGMLSFTCRKV